MKGLFVSVLIFLRRYSIELSQLVLIPVYFRIIFFVNARFDEPYPEWVVALLVSIVIMTIYAMAYLLYWWQAPNWLARVGAFATFYAAFCWFAYHLAYSWLPKGGIWLFDQERPFYLAEFLVNMTQLCMTFFLIAVGLVFLYWLRAYFRKKRQWEIDLHNASLKFVTAQITPHAVYNTLNTLQESLQDENPEEADVIGWLSAAMRYNTKQAERYRKPIPLPEEIEQIRRMEKLYRFRFRDKLFFQVFIDLEPDDFEIIPISVSTLLENAMKYGTSTDPAHPVKLTFSTDATHLVVSCVNKIRPYKPSEPSTGIGQANLRERLRLVYGKGAELITNNDGTFYTATIRIPLALANIKKP